MASVSTLCSDHATAKLIPTPGLELAVLHSKAVDYVKTGQPANMPRYLAPQKWPHFMEKIHKPLNKQYHSTKILGQLYDKVESVDFVPQYEEHFDKRILRAYQLDNAILKTARQTKSKYDISMRRIMAQQDIQTEFEVWSTFVLSKPKVGSDYKLQEEMAVISSALKDRFRSVCIEKAGGKDFSVLGPFVAAMYKVTKEELDIALAECHTMRVINGMEVPQRQMKPASMPLISFPWLFEKELGRIATGIEAIGDIAELGFETLSFKTPQFAASNRQAALSRQENDFVKQENGVIIHRGEILDLFQDEASDNDFKWDEEQSDIRSSPSTPALTPDYPIPQNGSVPLNVEMSSEILDKESTLRTHTPSSISTDLQAQATAQAEVKHASSTSSKELDFAETPTSSTSASFSPPVLLSNGDFGSNSSEDEEVEEEIEEISEEVEDEIVARSNLDKLSALMI